MRTLKLVPLSERGQTFINQFYANSLTQRGFKKVMENHLSIEWENIDDKE